MILIVPLDFNSIVQPLNSSCTSSGSTLVRVHASSHRGFGGATSTSGCCPFFLDTFAGPSLPFSLEKNPTIANVFVGCLFRCSAFGFSEEMDPLFVDRRAGHAASELLVVGSGAGDELFTQQGGEWHAGIQSRRVSQTSSGR